MFKLDLNGNHYGSILRGLLNKWNDNSEIKRSLIIVKISDAFTMYHQVVTDNWTVENRRFKNLHPVLINDLETKFNVILTLNAAGIIRHTCLIGSDGNLRSDDDLLNFVHKNVHQEYLDYFYCISKNIQRHLNDGAGAIDK